MSANPILTHRDAKTKTTLSNLNDRFRKGDPTVPGQVIITSGIDALLDEYDRPTGLLALCPVTAFETERQFCLARVFSSS